MLYAIRHITQYQYSKPIQENIMEVRKHPLSNAHQRCLNFTLTLEPEVRVFRYQDHLGNIVHHFDVPWLHQELSILGESVVEVRSPDPDEAAMSWTSLAAHIDQRDLYDMLQSSYLVAPCRELEELGQQLALSPERFETPQQLADHVNQSLFSTFTYERHSTAVDWPVSQVISQKRGVCQDYAHVMLGLLRQANIPCRYISGYRFDKDSPHQDTSHAWVEAYCKESGWCGYDPSRGCTTDLSYVTNCVGRDYADCPPTRGVYRGNAQGTLRHAVQVRPAEEPAQEDHFVLR
jgi:transglutaminase-like putative cysteine protease